MKFRPILLVEDDMLDAELTITALSESGLANEIVHVRDGTDALDYLYRRGTHAAGMPADPALILLDISMPKVDGFEVLKIIKSDAVLKALPVILLASSQAHLNRIVGRKVGANAHLVKPLTVQAFAQAVRAIGAFCAVLTEWPKGHYRNPSVSSGEDSRQS